jgi:hypothetical protein
MRSNANRAVAAVTAAAIALTAAGTVPAFAASDTPKEAASLASANTDFSSSHYYRGYGYRRHNEGAALAAAIIGGIAAYAAAREYRKARERSYYGYYDEPYGYYGRPHYWRGW